jgi:hypothetical protein
VQFRAEAFNILNHASFLPPLDFQGGNTAQLFNQNGTPLGGSAGGLTTLANLPRIIQFAVKVIF